MYLESGDAVVDSEDSKNHAQHHTQHQEEEEEVVENGMVSSDSSTVTTFRDRTVEFGNHHNCKNENGIDNHIYNRTTTHSTTTKPSNEQLLGVAFVTFFTFATVQMIYALHIAHSQAMMGDSAAMLVDAFTYLFNYMAERQKANTGLLWWLQPEHEYEYQTKNDVISEDGDDAVHDIHQDQRKDTGIAAMVVKIQQKKQRQDRKIVLHLEIIPPIISVTTLIIVTIFVIHKATRILILDVHRSKAQQTIPNLRLMFLFSCCNLVLDVVNVMCFARAKHCCGYSTTITTTTTTNNNKHHPSQHHHPRQYLTNGDSYRNNNDYNDDDDEENSAHSGTHLLEDAITTTTDDRILQIPQQQPTSPLNNLQKIILPMLVSGYSHVPTLDVVASSSMTNDSGNGCARNNQDSMTAACTNDTFVIQNHNDSDDDDNHVIIEDYDRYVELLQQNHVECCPTRTATTTYPIHNGNINLDNTNSNHHHHLHWEKDDTKEVDDDTTNLNMCSAYTHVFADTLRSIAVIIAAIVAELVPHITPEVADSTAAILVSILILLSLVPLIQGLIHSCHELQTIYTEEKLDAISSMTACMDHIEMT